MTNWKKVRAGYYRTIDSDGLTVFAYRTNGWWVKLCGTVRTRYATLADLKASVR